jgi:nucleotide-binding universal stress UspA family protein
MFERILMPTDGSRCSEYAIQKGVALAQSLRASATFLYVLENPMSTVWTAPDVPYTAQLLEDLQRVAEESLQEAAEVAKAAGVTYQTKLVNDTKPAEAILKAAKDHELIVMATHGRSGFDRLLMGSVTEGVLRRTETPLLVIRCPGQE